MLVTCNLDDQLLELSAIEWSELVTESCTYALFEPGKLVAGKCMRVTSSKSGQPIITCQVLELWEARLCQSREHIVYCEIDLKGESAKAYYFESDAVLPPEAIRHLSGYVNELTNLGDQPQTRTVAKLVRTVPPNSGAETGQPTYVIRIV